MSNQGKRQESVRAVTGTAYSYEGDWHALFSAAGIPNGTFNERLLSWINAQLSTSYVEINGAMNAFALSNGVASWNELGLLTAPSIVANFASPDWDVAPPSWLDYSGTTGNRMYVDHTGKLTWAPNNILLNSATLATQTVAVTSGSTIILSFTGTGSIALSGAATGTLAGTGANNRVSLVITPSTSSLTVTVSGDVRMAQLERVTYQTTPSTYVATTSAAYYGPRFDYDPSTVPATPRGLLIEEIRANLLTYSQTFQTNWVSNGTLLNDTGFSAPDGTLNARKIQADSTISAQYSLQQGPISASVGQSITNSVYVKYGSSQWVAIGIYDTTWFLACFDTINGVAGAVDSGITFSSASVGNGWYRISITRTLISTNFYHSIFLRPSNTTTLNWTANKSEFNYFFGGQAEIGSFATSYIPTTSASVTRAADVAQLTGSALTITTSNPATAAVEYLLPNNQASRRILWANEPSSGNYTNNVRLTSDSVGLVAATVDKTRSIAYTSGQINRLIMGWGGAGWSACQNAGTLQTDTSAMPTGLTVTRLGSHNDGVYLNGYVRSMALYNQRLPDAILNQKSTPGAPY